MNPVVSYGKNGFDGYAIRAEQPSYVAGHAEQSLDVTATTDATPTPQATFGITLPEPSITQNPNQQAHIDENPLITANPANESPAQPQVSRSQPAPTHKTSNTTQPVETPKPSPSAVETSSTPLKNIRPAVTTTVIPARLEAPVSTQPTNEHIPFYLAVGAVAFLLGSGIKRHSHRSQQSSQDKSPR